MTEVDVVVVGAGFAGLRSLYGLRNLGLKVTVLEASKGVGGVWYHNGYPGARCDVESYDYSYMFSPELEQDWRWTERYARQPEILRYIHHVVERFDLLKDIELNARVTRAQYNEESRRWHVTTQDGRAWDSRTLVLCVGQLSAPKRPSYPGQGTFGGEVYHSGEWPKHEVSFADKRVAIIGTGSSGVQMTPVIALQAKRLTVFQRTPNYSIPAANAPVSEEEDRQVKADYRRRRRQALNSPSGLGFIPNKTSALDATPLERELVYEAAWNRLGFGFALAYYDLLRSKPANDTAAEFIRRKIAVAVDDPVIRDKLTPKDFPFGTRRPSVDSGYFQTFNRANVQLVDLRETPIQEFTPTGIRTTAKLHEFDIVIFATGFDVFTGSLLKPEIIGRGGLTLREKWSAGPITYLGVGVADFPNLFIVVGPGSPSLLSNVLVSTEQQVQWLEGLMRHVQTQGIAEFEVTPQAETAWVEHVNKRSKETLYPTTPSFYMGSEVPGKPHVFMPYSGGVRDYRRILEKCAAAGYDGFSFRPATEPTRKRNAG